ncbi:MAG: hypothetical protein K2P57_09785 [Burkholderiales bacterium]|nr:hypothetical protein [Burkholderiales bacterium]
MRLIRRIEHVDENHQVLLKDIPEALGKEIVVMVFPAGSEQDKGLEEWKMLGLVSMFDSEEDEDIDWDEHFGL